MLTVFKFLEPISFEKGEIIYGELDDCDQVFFVYYGKYNIGYEINKHTKMKLRFGSSTIIGGFEVSFDRRCVYIY